MRACAGRGSRRSRDLRRVWEVQWGVTFAIYLLARGRARGRRRGAVRARRGRSAPLREYILIEIEIPFPFVVHLGQEVFRLKMSCDGGKCILA